jgi:hypothetical protein
VKRQAGALLAAAVLGVATAAADEVRGTDAVLVERGLALLWGVVVGPDEARARAVLLIQRLDPAAAPWRLVSVEAVDPLTGRAEWVALARDLGATGAVIVDMPREGFLTRPTRRVLFFRHAAALQTRHPELIVTYPGLPDRAPELATRAELDQHFRTILDRLRTP